MSGSNYGGPNATIETVIKIEINCELCTEFVINHIKQTKGIQSLTRGKKQLTVVQKLHPLKIRKNINFSKPRKMTAVMGVNIDCKGCDKRMEKIIKSTPGFQDMSFNKNTRLVEVKGTIAINTLADKLEKKLGKIVKIIDMKIEGGDIGSYSCLKTSTGPFKSIGEILI